MGFRRGEARVIRRVLSHERLWELIVEQFFNLGLLNFAACYGFRCVSSQVILQGVFMRKSRFTLRTFKWPLSRVNPRVSREGSLLCKRRVTHRTFIRLVACMSSHMRCHICLYGERRITIGALIRSLACMGALVNYQMMSKQTRLIALSAFIGLFTSVSSHMQL